ncbi:MAG: hypothetical protein GY953_08790, partial [bacterium]|nr:hypothetical protein [bacterium]
LNGEWEFRFDPRDLGVDERWYAEKAIYDRRITVPFCWESKLSGVTDTSGQQIGWYRREISVPGGWQGQRVWLRFEAVDWEATVWVNDIKVGTHEGGYTPFAIDITEQAPPGETARVVVRAYDPTDRELPTGKQIAFWYTFTSGIWQTVWLEARPATYLDSMHMSPRGDGDEWTLDVSATLRGADGEATVKLASEDTTVTGTENTVMVEEGKGEFEATLVITSPKLWTPDTPELYDLEVTVKVAGEPADTVKTYFGLRSISRGRYGDAPYESILLNGKPVYLRGALDQSFNPDGIHTAPDDEFLRRDMELAKSTGLNCLRIHIKPDEPRRLYWADKLGVLIMEDMPNTWEFSDRAREAWERTMREALARDRNHPSVFSWVLFNETWGLGSSAEYFNDFMDNPEAQQWVKEVFEEVKQSDPTRLVEDNSPDGRDHVVTDINSWHFYIDDYERAKAHIEEVVEATRPGSAFNYVPGHQQGTAPLINSEYGAVSASGGDRDISWGFRSLTTLLRKHEKIQGYIYTELTDIEFEHNGLFNYDRSAKEFGYDAFVAGMTVADLQGEDFIGFDSPPVIVAEPGGEVIVPIFVSHFSDREGEIMVKPYLVGFDDLASEVRVDLDSRPVSWERFRVSQQQPLEVTLPAGRGFAGALAMELLADGERIAANFVNVVAHRDPPPARRGRPVQKLERIDSKRVALRVSPMAPSLLTWKGAGAPTRLARRFNSSKFFFHGAGTIEYRFQVPEEVIAANPIRLGLLAEVSTKARDEKLDWPQQSNPLDYPQTDGRKHPGALHIIINGHRLEPLEVEDDPADARGLLSHAAKYHHGSHGYMVRAEMHLMDMPDVVTRLRDKPEVRVIFDVPAEEVAGGLSVYGARMGRYPLDPTVVVETEREIEWRSQEFEKNSPAPE